MNDPIDETLAREFESQFDDLARGRSTVENLLAWAGGIDRAKGSKPLGAFLFAGAGVPEDIPNFRAPSPRECQVLEAAVRRGQFAVEDALVLVLLRHQRSRQEVPLLDWLVRFEALHPSEADEIRLELG